METINKSQFSIMDKLTKMASKYFDISEDDAKIGLFGYITEGCSMIHEEGMVHRSLQMNEIFLNTCMTSTAINNFAIQNNYNMDNIVAYPSDTSILFAIGYSDIQKYLENGVYVDSRENRDTFVINRTNEFQVGDKVFSIPYSVIIKFNSNGTILARYDLNESPVNNIIKQYYNKYSYIKAKISDVKIDDGTIIKILYLNLDLYQFKIDEQIFENIDYKKSLDSITQYTINYEGGFTNFNVSYKAKESDTNWELITKYFDTNKSGEDGEKVCYYQLIDDNSFVISFNPLYGFSPAFGSYIKVEIFITEGAAGNFQYVSSEPLYFAFSNKEKQTIYTVSKLLPDTPSGNISTIKNGRNKPTLLEIKESILNQKIAHDNITSDDDIQKLFQQITNDIFTTDSISTIFKKRFDIVSKKITNYLTLYDMNNALIPSNTVELAVDSEYLIRNNFILNYGTLIYYNRLTSRYEILDDDQFSVDMLNDYNFHVYTIPYALRVVLDYKPVPRVDYFQFYVSGQYEGIYEYKDNTNSVSFIMNQFKLNRGILRNDNFVFNTNITINNNDKEIDVVNDMVVRIFFSDGIDTSKFTGYLDLYWDNDFWTREMKINNNNTIVYDQYNRQTLACAVDSSLLNANVNVTELNNITIAIYCKTDDPSPIPVPSKFNWNDDGKLNGKELCCIFNFDDVKFFKYLNTFMHSDLNQKAEEKFIIVNIKDVPLISAGYYFNSKQLEELNVKLDEYINEVSKSIRNFESNTKIDIKFSNNYGLSKLTTSVFTNIKIDLIVKLIDKSLLSDTLTESIKKSICELVYAVNTSSDGVLGVSNITTQLENNFGEISYCKVQKINNLLPDNIKVTTKDELTLEQQINNVPEIINIIPDNINITYI